MSKLNDNAVDEVEKLDGLSESEQQFAKKIQNILENPNPNINKDKRIKILKKISVSSSLLIQEKSHSGPLPDPDTLIKYNTVIPDGADRIMKMAEKQQNHRMQVENKIITQSKLGQIFGLIIGIFGIASGTYLASTGATTVGGIIAGGTVVSLVSVFVLGRKRKRKSTAD